MRIRRPELVTRALVALFACVLFVAPLVGVAHASEHHGAVDSVDCGTCHWSKNITGTVIEAPAVAFVATVEVARTVAVTEPDLRLQSSEFHSRGPPSLRV